MGSSADPGDADTSFDHVALSPTTGTASVASIWMGNRIATSVIGPQHRFTTSAANLRVRADD